MVAAWHEASKGQVQAVCGMQPAEDWIEGEGREGIHGEVCLTVAGRTSCLWQFAPEWQVVCVGRGQPRSLVVVVGRHTAPCLMGVGGAGGCSPSWYRQHT